jgi:phosphoglucosamine mutase
VAGEYPLDPATIFALGMALGHDIGAARKQAAAAGQAVDGELDSGLAARPDAEVLVGSDTRESSPWIAETVAGGLAQAGIRARSAGVITTPGVAYLTRTGRFAAGVMISASHNPYRDNGIKVFGHSGFKLPDSEEHAIEQEIFRSREGVKPAPLKLTEDIELRRSYLEFLTSTLTVRLDGMHLAMDCGNGAASSLAPELFRRLGARVTAICIEPNGRNINLNCGALHLESLQELVLSSGAEFGVAFDGDADRALFVAKSGKIVDGDAVLLIAARALKAAGHLQQDTVVATVMSNLGLEKALEREGIRMVRTPVGDKYVLEEMVRLGAALGGEQSGHVIFREYATTGDGLLTALRVLEIARRAGVGLDELTSDFQVYPQKLVNVRVREKKGLLEIPSVAREIRRAEEAYAGAGRVLVRFSGTEPLARVMVEGPDLERVESFSESIAEAIRREMGA